MTAADRTNLHLRKQSSSVRWTACGLRAALVPTIPNPALVTCPACRTHVDRIETPNNR